MGEYMRTLLNGLKTWVGGEINKLRAKIEAVATAVSNTASLAAKNKKDIAELGNGLDNAWGSIGSAQTEARTALNNANSAASVASTAKSTADTAKSTADTAKSTADTARSNASSALSAANSAATKASSAQTAANEAKQNAASALAKANAASTTAENAYPKLGAQKLYIRDADVIMSGNTWIEAAKGEPVTWFIPKYLDANAYAPARLVLKPNGSNVMRVEGITVLRMKSSGNKEFDITASDDGTLSATEVTS